MEVKIMQVRQKYWHLFRPYLDGGRCSSMPFPAGKAFAICANHLDDREDIGEGGIRSFVKYAHGFRHSPYRCYSIPDMPKKYSSGEMDFLKKNIRQLARIGTFYQWRNKGYALDLINGTLPMLGVKYVECITCHIDVAKVLIKAGFKNRGWNEKAQAWYYLWTSE